ncbi:MAG: hypothetical protein JNL97_14495 [Verrucomicrobiales bacterium]|nr:hypothetical protein [Verrucomicrobiales bacterium]
MSIVLGSAVASGIESNVVVTLGGVPPAQCGVSFLHSGFTLTLTNSALGRGAEGHCSFDPGSTFLSLYPGNLRIDLGSLPGRLLRVEADAYDGCGRGCTKLLLASGDGIVAVITNSGPGPVELVAPAPDDKVVDAVYLSSFEGSFLRVRLILDVPPGAPTLTYRRDGDRIRLAWPKSFPDCAVQEAKAWASPTSWAPVLEPPTADAENFQVQVRPAGGSTFYRLACPGTRR